MSFGIGLGAFVDGFEGGMKMGEKIKERQKERKIEGGIKQIEEDTAKKFDDPLSDEAYDYMMRRQELLYRQNGDLGTAMKFRKFAQEDDTRKGAKLFASSMFKAQTGDAAGALQDAIKVGNLKGYIESGYEVLGQDPIMDGDNTVGYRLKIKTPDGKEMQQDIAVSDIPRIVATFANPTAAFDSQQAQAEAKRKRGESLEDYEARKKVDEKYGKNTSADDYRKVEEGLAKSDLDWADRSAEEKDRLVRERLAAADTYAGEKSGTGGDAAEGGPAETPQKVIVDEGTGQVIQPGAQPVGLGDAAAVAPNAPSPAPAPQPGIDGAAAAGRAAGEAVQAIPTPSPRPGEDQSSQAPKGPDKAQLIQDAANYMVNGGNPELIAQRLMNAGVSETEWPSNVRSALVKKRPNQGIGLGQ